MTSGTVECPTCGLLTAHDVMGYHIRGVYDGVLFWLCKQCGRAFQRWPEDFYLHAKAQPYIEEFNKEVAR